MIEPSLHLRTLLLLLLSLLVVEPYDLETFQMGWAQYHPSRKRLPTMCLDKTIGFRPGQKRLLRGPSRMRHVVNRPVVTLPTQELKEFKAWCAL